jgi:hypothetical protein
MVIFKKMKQENVPKPVGKRGKGHGALLMGI